MELQTNNRQQQTKKVLPITILMGVLLMVIPVGATLLITKPELLALIKNSFGEIAKGIAIGLSILPITLLVAFKGQKTWYKKPWCLALLGVTAVIIFAIVLIV
jgi:hypothetical protein